MLSVCEFPASIAAWEMCLALMNLLVEWGILHLLNKPNRQNKVVLFTPILHCAAHSVLEEHVWKSINMRYNWANVLNRSLNTVMLCRTFTKTSIICSLHVLCCLTEGNLRRFPCSRDVYRTHGDGVTQQIVSCQDLFWFNAWNRIFFALSCVSLFICSVASLALWVITVTLPLFPAQL